VRALENECRKYVNDGGIGGADMALREKGGVYEVGSLREEVEVAATREVAGEVTLYNMGMMIDTGMREWQRSMLE
jgi:hypothetical protein